MMNFETTPKFFRQKIKLQSYLEDKNIEMNNHQWRNIFHNFRMGLDYKGKISFHNSSQYNLVDIYT